MAQEINNIRQHWTLSPTHRFLNHGSYGACPTAVLDHQSQLQELLESSPRQFVRRHYPELLEVVRARTADFLKAKPEHLVFVENATAGVNAVLKSLAWQAGDEILVTDHGYNACNNVVRYLAETRGIKVVEVALPFPTVDPEMMQDLILAQLSQKTKLVMLDHVSSPTALVFPIASIAQELKERSLPLLVDGAHAPGMLDLNLEDLGESGVTYYTGNFHKWCCAPKGAAFLWVAQKDQGDIHPAVLSHGYNSSTDRPKFLEEFDWCGTFDPTARLSVAVALDWLGKLYPGGWPELRTHCHALLLEGRSLVLKVLSEQPLVPQSMLGQIASLKIPKRDPMELYDRLYGEHLIDGMFCRWNDQDFVRISAAPYNTREDYEALSKALSQLIYQKD